ncbi:MAG: thiamine diphosphokinase [Clostridia bacterium]|nr:thiamine diphosphokinase [Clostridia bacterium]
MKKICAIISGGEFAPLENIENADFVIVCDKGYEYAKMSGITPDLIVGDFDSFSGELPKEITTVTLPCEKDETDTMAAVKYAVDSGFSEIQLFCALGGRLDHLLGNLQTAAYAAKSGVFVKIADRENESYVFSNSKISIPKKDGFSLSLISLTDKCENVSILGGKYTLDNAVLTNASTLGISNEWVNDITVSVGDGVLAVVISKMGE